jgi:hypothetical protein
MVLTGLYTGSNGKLAVGEGVVPNNYLTDDTILADFKITNGLGGNESILRIIDENVSSYINVSKYINMQDQTIRGLNTSLVTPENDNSYLDYAASVQYVIDKITGGDTDLVADNIIINGSAIVNGSIYLGNNINDDELIVNASTIFNSTLNLNDTTNSISKDTGALIIEGGIGIEKDVYIGGSLNIESITNSISKDTGALIIEGGVGIEKDINIGGNANIGKNIIITGNLTVLGTQLIANSETSQFEDPLLIFGNGSIGDSSDIGFLGQYDISGNKRYAGLFRDATNSEFYLVGDINHNPITDNTISSFTQNNYANLNLNSLLVNSTLDINGNVDADVTDFDILSSGAISLDSITDSNFTVTSNDGSDTTLTISSTNSGAGDGIISVNSNTLNISSTTNITDTTTSTSKDTGALVVDGGVGIEENLYIGGNADITGNLNVFGTTSFTGDSVFDVLIVNNHTYLGNNYETDVLIVNATSTFNSDVAINGNMSINSPDTVTMDSINDISIDSSTGNISIGSDNVTGDINIGNSVSARTINIGNDVSTKIDINALDIELDSAGPITVNGTGDINIQTQGGQTINIGTDENGQSLFLGNHNSVETHLHGGLIHIDSKTDMILNLNTSSGIDTHLNLLSTNSGAGNGRIALTSDIIDTYGIIYSFDTTQSTSKDSGSAIFEGGIGIEKNLFVGGYINVQENSIFNNDVIITGNLTIIGNQSVLNVLSYVTEDPLLILGNESTSDILDIGFLGQYDVTGTKKYAGLFRDASNSEFYLVGDIEHNPITNNVVDTFSQDNYANLNLNSLLVNSTLDINGNIDADVTSVDIISSGIISIDGVDNMNYSLIANDVSNKVLTIDAINSGAGDATIDIDAANGITIDSVSGNLDFGTDNNTGGINIGTSVSARTITIGNDASTKVDINALAIELDSSGPIDIDATSSLSINTLDGQNINIGNDFNSQSIIIGNSISSDITIDSIIVSIDSSDNSNFSITSNNTSDKTLTFSSTNSGTGDGIIVINSDILNISSITNIIDTTGSSSKDTGALVVDGGVGIEENLYIGGNTDITGNLNVLGITSFSGESEFDILNVNIALNSNGSTYLGNFADDELIVNATTTFNSDITIGTNKFNVESTNGTTTILGGLSIGTSIQPTVSLEIIGNDALLIPSGTSAQRPSSAINGYIRYNQDQSSFEGYASNAWSSLGGVKDVDADTYINAENSPGNDDDTLHFVTTNIERMSINNDNLFINSNNDTFNMIYYGNDGNTLFTINTSITDDTNDAIGCVGIGKIPNGYRLDVDGGIRVSTHIFSDSDINLKTNITDLNNILDNMLQIKTVKFDWIDKSLNNGKQNIGTIAQSIEQFFPELVFENNSGIKSVAYDKITILNLQSIKELNNKFNDTIDNRDIIINNLNSKIDNLTNTVKLINDKIELLMF